MPCKPVGLIEDKPEPKDMDIKLCVFDLKLGFCTYCNKYGSNARGECKSMMHFSEEFGSLIAKSRCILIAGYWQLLLLETALC